jgi:hypothetical protein
MTACRSRRVDAKSARPFRQSRSEVSAVPDPSVAIVRKQRRVISVASSATSAFARLSHVVHRCEPLPPMQVLSATAHRARNLQQEPRRGRREIIAREDPPHASASATTSEQVHPRFDRDDRRAHQVRDEFLLGFHRGAPEGVLGKMRSVAQAGGRSAEIDARSARHIAATRRVRDALGKRRKPFASRDGGGAAGAANPR